MEKKRGNNKGFSLIELIVAVLIVGILSGGALAAFSSVREAKSESAAKTLASVLKQARQKAMAVDNVTQADRTTKVYVEIYQSTDDGQYYADIIWNAGSEETIASEKLGNDNLGLVLREYDSTNSVYVTASDRTIGDGTAGTHKIKIYFKKSTGGISLIDTGAGETLLGTCPWNEIQVSGSGDDKSIILVHPTGRCFYED